MLTLGASHIEFRGSLIGQPRKVVRVSTNPKRPAGLRTFEAFLVSSEEIPHGFDSYILLASTLARIDPIAIPGGAVILPDSFAYLGDGDILRLAPETGEVRVLYRKASSSNNFLVTERCNHYCLMCSQPPRDIDDSWIVEEILDAVPLIDVSTNEIGFTGGEPTLLGEDFFRILRQMKSYLPRTAIHILSNGRRFADGTFAADYASIHHADIMVGIPLYSDVSSIHDYVVQADGAFDETIRGILNLKRLGQRVEVRVVVHKQTYGRLPQLADFIYRNLTFVDHVAFMGLEITGFTKGNLPDLWIDPVDYQDELYEAVMLLANRQMHVSIYNHQLCLIREELWPFARKSISDWKNEYFAECSGCAKKSECGGFFSSARIKRSRSIRAIS